VKYVVNSPVLHVIPVRLLIIALDNIKNNIGDKVIKHSVKKEPIKINKKYYNLKNI
jgi:hypothetical protein